jgi:ABC-type multidrug transport system ATPase subunit
MRILKKFLIISKENKEQSQFIQINNLKKKFGSNFYAVDGLKAEMYEDEIFALLGHNGAGKTTAINML